MDINTLIGLAHNGDIKAIMTLGRFYGDFKNKENLDISESIKWYTIGARLGNIDCMYLASLMGLLNGHAILKIAPREWEKVVPQLKEALYWAEQALNGGNEAAEKQIISVKGELGAAYMYGGMCNNKTNEEAAYSYFISSVDYLKSVYKKTITNESTAHLGISLFYINCYLFERKGISSCLDTYLMINCLEEYIDAHIATDEYVGMIYSFLGIIYTYGIGCDKNYSRAVECYKTATTQCDYDCSDELLKFKKKLFGGYSFSE